MGAFTRRGAQFGRRVLRVIDGELQRLSSLYVAARRAGSARQEQLRRQIDELTAHQSRTEGRVTGLQPRQRREG